MEEDPTSQSTIKPLEGAHGASRARFIREKYADKAYYSKPVHNQHVEEETRPKIQTPRKLRTSLMAFLKKDNNNIGGGSTTRSVGPFTFGKYEGKRGVNAVVCNSKGKAM